MSESQEYVTVCQLMRTHGVKGYIKALPLTYDLTRHQSLKEVLLKKTNGEEVSLTLEDSKLAGNLWLLKFQGYDSPEAVAHFTNGDLMIPESERLPLPDGQFYLDEVEGYKVALEDGRIVGKVLEVQELPTVNAFLIQFDEDFQQEFSKKTILAPWIDDCLNSIERKNQTATFDSQYLKALCPEERP